MKSIIQRDDSRCYICGSRQWLEWHHVYGGGLRSVSEQYGLKVRLCHYCHNEPPNGVHQNKEIRLLLQAKVQRKAMKHYGWTVNDFIARFRKNYI